MGWSEKIVLGNWKMNGSLQSIEEYFVGLNFNHLPYNQTIGLAIPFPYLFKVHNKISELAWSLGVQDISQFLNYGAYTGEINTQMLQDFDIKFSLVGHSERRLYFQEDEKILRKKLSNLIISGITPVFCVGENLSEKSAGLTEKVLAQQLNTLAKLSFNHLIIAYEPVWAIGSGKIPTIDEIELSFSYIDDYLLSIQIEADKIQLLYGGSVTPGNALTIMSVDKVSGLLVGGASLKPSDFIKIIQTI